MKEAKALIITGMSGAGKTQVMRILEDLHFYCVDNLPVTLLPNFTALCRQEGSGIERVALVVDIRGGKFFTQLATVLTDLECKGEKYELLFMDASDNTLVKRYKETRRRHPLAEDESLITAIRKERQILSSIRQKADRLIDTSVMDISALRAQIIGLYCTDDPKLLLDIIVESFGFKHGMPLDSDMLFDVRFLPNPYYEPHLKELCGKDQAVQDYIQAQAVTGEFFTKLNALVSFLLPQYVREGKSQLIIGVGCTGGRHRSVYTALNLGDYIRSLGYNVRVVHRDLKEQQQ